MEDVVDRDAFWMELFREDLKDCWKDDALAVVLLEVGGVGEVVILPL